MPWTRGSLLGEGGYGRVFECLDDDGRICAAKVVPLRPGDDERSPISVMYNSNNGSAGASDNSGPSTAAAASRQ